jgi:site-specific DNA recombinase
MKDGTRTLGYLRVSTTGQAEEGYSMEAQEKKIRAYADLHDLELIEIIEDAGLSGKTIAGRPGIQRVLEMVKAGKVDNVVILKLDRLARNVKEAIEISDLLQKRGVSLHSISEKLDTGSASGRLFYNILSAMSQWERETIAERTRTALAVKKDKGERISGKAPYGYTFTDDGLLEENETEQATLRTIRELKAEGHTVRGIVTHLAEHGIVNRKGNNFGVKEVWTISKAA